MNDTDRRRRTLVRSYASRMGIEGLERRVFLSADATPPTVLGAEFVFDAFPNPERQTVTIAFSEDVHRSLNAQDIKLENLTTGATVPASQIRDNFNNETNVASISFDNDGPLAASFTSKAFPDGNYRLTLPAGSVKDEAGNALATDFTFDFFVLAGDANRDRVVDVADLGVLATNWQSESRTFSQADFSYDGKVDVEDLGILATNWRKSLPAPVATTAAAKS